MSGQLNTQDDMALLLLQAKEGLATQPTGQVVIQQIHIHQGGEATPEGPQGLLRSTFRGTVRWVLQPVGQVLKWGTAPVWFPLSMGLRDVLATPQRVGKALADPWRQDYQALREDHALWKAATPEERQAIVAQARGWLGLAVALCASTLLVPGALKWLPILTFLGLWEVQEGWCPVRAYLGLSQGGWQGLGEHVWRQVQILRHGGVVAHRAAAAQELPQEAQEQAEEPVVAIEALPQAEATW